MEGCQRNGESRHKLLDFMIPKDRERYYEDKRSHGCCCSSTTEEKKLELRLGPPGAYDDCLAVKKTEQNNNMENIKKQAQDHQSLLSLGHHNFSSPSITKARAVPHTSQKRTAPGPLVGWPPVRSSRKNLAANASSSKPGNESSTGVQNKGDGEKSTEPKRKGLFVKINMDGVPIGRKIDLNAYDSYDKLSVAVDQLFRGLLAAQRDPSGSGNKQGEEKLITGLIDGNGEYTLTYEDNEGDKMLVGDVPWHMFVSSVKRLRVIKTSEISSALTFGINKQGKMTN